MLSKHARSRFGYIIFSDRVPAKGFDLIYEKDLPTMKLEHTDLIHAPLDKVYSLVKDEMPKIAQFLPSIREIKVLEREKKADGRDYIVNQWFAEPNIPTLAKKFINENLFSWKDVAYWNDTLRQVDYEIEPFFAGDIYKARGTNIFCPVDGKVRLTLICEVNIYPEKIPGIPKFIAKQIHPMLEQMIEKMLAPNLTSLGKGLKEYLRAEASR